MTPSRFFVPSSESFSTKRLIVKKLFTTFFAALALLCATLNTAGDPSFALDAHGEEGLASPVRPGLSRTRPAFRKAIGMLADAASSNDRLADYYDRVTRRVTGGSANGEENLDAVVVKTVPKRDARRPAPTGIKSAAASDVPQQSTLRQSDTSAITAGLIQYSASSESMRNDFQPEADAGTGTQQQFTVGDMAFDTNPAIEQWMNYYIGTPVGRRTLRIGIERSNSYLEMARAEFRNAGVPEDLVWLAFVESVWNPRAVSPAAAGGIWQFIPATATDYGLKVEHGNDERANPLKQTRVAAAYLRDLYTIFGDWTLAMAAYNSGEPRVMGAIVRNGNANFWELYDKQLLPKETCNYVPKILATIRVASQAEEYGLLPQSEAQVSSGS